MNALEVFEQFKQLPQHEQGKVVEFIQESVSDRLQFARNEDALAAAKAVFDEHPELFRKLAQ